VTGIAGGDEQSSMATLALEEATGRTDNAEKRENKGKEKAADKQAIVLGSGNLGLVYLMEEERRLTMEEIDERPPRLLPALREHPHVGWILVRSSKDGPLALGRNGVRYLA